MEAVHLIADGKAPRIPQPKEGATYEGIQKKENAEVVWSNTVFFMHSARKVINSDYSSGNMKLMWILTELFPHLFFLEYLLGCM